jgi:hypothetical protein
LFNFVVCLLFYCNAYFNHLRLLIGISPNGSPNEAAQFDCLWIAATVSAFLPLLVLPSVFFLIPDTLQGETMLEQEAVGSSAGDDVNTKDVEGVRDDSSCSDQSLQMLDEETLLRE